MFSKTLLAIALSSVLLADSPFKIVVSKSKDKIYESKPFVSKKECTLKGDKYIFAANECINYNYVEGDNENELTIFFPAAWPVDTNVLNRYSTFIEDLNLETDITTAVVALPGYNDSSTNKFTPIKLKENKDLILKKEFISFVSELVKNLKKKHSAKKVNFIGHSSGAMIGALLSGYSPKLVSKYILAGGRYDQVAEDDNQDFLTVEKALNRMSKDTQTLLIFGSKDLVSKPKVSKKYYDLAKKRDLNIKIVEVLNSPHFNLEQKEKSLKEIAVFLL